MGGGYQWECPDWRQYKVENANQLVELEKKLAAEGLKNPWLRNHVWRYDNVSALTKFNRNLFRSFKWALLATVITVGVETALKQDDGHH